MANIERMKNAEINIRKRVDCDEKAFHLVNKLIDGNVDGSYLSECGKFLTRENYEDIVEERAISKLCGYPVCDQPLPNVPKKKYHISTKANKVYDISERKNFCSNQCLKASKFFQQQIPDMPVWAREDEEPVDIAVSPHKGILGMIGDEVIGNHLKEVLKDEVEKMKKMDNTDARTSLRKKMSGNVAMNSNSNGDLEHNLVVTEKQETADCLNSDKELEQAIIRDIESEFNRDSFGNEEDGDSGIREPSSEIKSQFTASSNQNKINSLPQASSKLDQLQKLLSQRKHMLSEMVDLQDTQLCNKSNTNHQKRSIQSDDAAPVKALQPPKPHSHNRNRDTACVKTPKPGPQYPKSHSHNQSSMSSSSQPISPLNSVCGVLKKWMSVTTVEYLEYKLIHAGVSEPIDKLTSDLSELEIDCDPFTNTLNEKKKELSQFLGDCESDQLETQGKTFHQDLKSVPDYKGLKEESKQFELKVREFITGKPVKGITNQMSDKAKENPVYIPTVDTYDHAQIRAKIVLEKLDKSLPSILVPMCLSVQDVSSLIREMVYTFRLERDTIFFKPAEWMLVSLVLLKMLSHKVRSIAEAFQRDSSVRFLIVLLGGIRHTMDDLDRVTSDILAVASVPFDPCTS